MIINMGYEPYITPAWTPKKSKKVGFLDFMQYADLG
jgi:ABC-type cobalt transport system substrate-binding protein